MEVTRIEVEGRLAARVTGEGATLYRVHGDEQLPPEEAWRLLVKAFPEAAEGRQMPDGCVLVTHQP
jgi:hypothetical protein